MPLAHNKTLINKAYKNLLSSHQTDIISSILMTL